MRIYSLLIVLLTSIMLACQKEKVTGNDSPLNYSMETISYKYMNGVDPNLLSLDIYFDAHKRDLKPVIVWVHGGGWCKGDKSNKMENKKRLFASLGYLLVSVNYRLSPYPYEINNPQRIKFPIHNIDLADALKRIQDNIDDYGGNPRQIVLMGHSAGAHLVALTCTNQHYLLQSGFDPSNIKGVAIIDTRMYDVYHSIQEIANPPALYLNAFGDDPQENLDASPIRNLHNHYFPKFFVAKRGNTERLRAANEFISALQQNHIDVVSLEAYDYSHSEINDAIGMENENVITPALISFLNVCFED